MNQPLSHEYDVHHPVGGRAGTNVSEECSIERIIEIEREEAKIGEYGMDVME